MKAKISAFQWESDEPAGQFTSDFDHEELSPFFELELEP